MRVYTHEDLKIMQAWPLERKIQVTQTRILEWYYHYEGNVAVSFSGGKDSSVALDLVRRAFPDVPAVFVDTGLEYPEIRDFVKATPNVIWLRPELPFTKVIEQYGYPVISKDVAKHIYYARRGSNWAIQHMNGRNSDGTPSWYDQRYMKWRFLLDAPFLISDRCCAVMKERPLQKYTRATGSMQIVGTLACESMRRTDAYLKTGCNAFNKAANDRHPLFPGLWRYCREKRQACDHRRAAHGLYVLHVRPASGEKTEPLPAHGPDPPQAAQFLYQ